MISKVRIIEPGHPLFGQCLEVSATRYDHRPGWVRVVLPDGRRRWILEMATDLTDSACGARPNHDLPLVSVRTLLPLANYVRSLLSDLGERVDGTPGHSADPAARAGIAGSCGDPGPEIVAGDDANNPATSGETGGTPASGGALCGRRSHTERGASR